MIIVMPGNRLVNIGDFRDIYPVDSINVPMEGEKWKYYIQIVWQDKTNERFGFESKKERDEAFTILLAGIAHEHPSITWKTISEKDLTDEKDK